MVQNFVNSRREVRSDVAEQPVAPAILLHRVAINDDDWAMAAARSLKAMEAVRICSALNVALDRGILVDTSVERRANQVVI
jgi:hypothetical protein